VVVHHAARRTVATSISRAAVRRCMTVATTGGGPMVAVALSTVS
jgi:hypothetical protein